MSADVILKMTIKLSLLDLKMNELYTVKHGNKELFGRPKIVL